MNGDHYLCKVVGTGSECKLFILDYLGRFLLILCRDV